MSDTDNAGGDQVKKGRGRPRKSEPRNEHKAEVAAEEPKAKRGRGRPKVVAKKGRKAAGSSSTGKRGRGRPKKSESKDSKADSDQGEASGSDKDD